MIALDQLVTQVADGVEASQRLHRSSKRAQAVLGPARREQGRIWTLKEKQYLRENLVDLGFAAVAKTLGRTVTAVKIKSIRLGVEGSPSRNQRYYTAHQAAKALGTDVHAVLQWRRLGLIDMERTPVRNRVIWRISRQKLLAWAVNPNHWPYFLYDKNWNIRRIRDHKIARMINLRYGRWNDEWIPAGEACRLMGVEPKDLNRVFIHQGKYRGRKVKIGNWVYLRSDVLSANIRFLKGRGTGHRHEKTTDNAIDFLVLAAAVGLNADVIHSMMGGYSQFCMANKLRELDKGGRLEEICARQEICIRRDGGDIYLFYDWRRQPGRFPFIARAANRFFAGKKLSTAELLVLNRMLFLHGMRFGHGDLLHLVSRWRWIGSRNPQLVLHNRYDKLVECGIEAFV